MMRKWIFGLIVIVVLFVAGTYMFIPAKVKITSSISVKANREGVFRYLAQRDNWKQWWPDTTSFKMHQYLYNAFVISIYSNGDTSNSLLTLIPIT